MIDQIIVRASKRLGSAVIAGDLKMTMSQNPAWPQPRFHFTFREDGHPIFYHMRSMNYEELRSARTRDYLSTGYGEFRIKPEDWELLFLTADSLALGL